MKLLISKTLMMAALATPMLVSGLAPSLAQATPEQDVETFRALYQQRFPDLAIDEYVNGVYAIDPIGRESWEAIEDFPPYEQFIDDGEAMWESAFANGKGYSSCFPKGPAIASQYPQWDSERSTVVTLPMAVNECRVANGEKPLKYKKGAINALLAYIAFNSRGQITAVEIPANDPAALAAYEDGKAFYFKRRGQLNFSCANCHMQNPGMKIRSEVISPALGHTTHFPIYRSKWGDMGTLQRRITGCNKQVRAKPFKAQSEQYRNLEYFLTYMSNGLPLNGPGARK